MGWSKCGEGTVLHCNFGLPLSLQNQIDLSSVLTADNSEVNTVAATQENVTEAMGSPLAMWELEIQNIELEKGEGGLGFSILDYQVGDSLLVCYIQLHSAY